MNFADMTFRKRAFQFAVWAVKLRQFHSAKQIGDHFGVSRATAYKLRADWADALGIEAPSFRGKAVGT